MNRIRLLLTNSRGQSLVEFALILPILIMLLFGIIEFGRIYNASLTVTAAAREGARSAAVGNSNAVVETTVRSFMPGDQSNITVAAYPSVRVSGQPVTVTVSEKVQIITPLIKHVIPSNMMSGDRIVVSGSAVMVVE